ncbi:MAG: BREX-2 system adenine-specific DNA-methyltransferase PglX [Gemmatimonadales bacterium]|nr:MAG: BREX-2 system adenine-specific DNA-methyltransferase PglX [Gemmatimonadales bacterium]
MLDRGGKVFKQSAPVIKLPEEATEEDHLRLLGLLNSSTACFWMKQVFHGKGQGGVGQESRAEWEEFIEHDGTKLQQFPIPATTPLERPQTLDTLAQELSATLPAAVVDAAPPTRERLQAAREQVRSLRARMVALQEELDWECYHHYGLLEHPMALPTDALPELHRGERAFEIALARDMAAGKVRSTWFERHGSTPVTELPAHWPDRYREAVEARIALIRSDRKIRLLERPEYKRRWNWDDWDTLEQDALRTWLLDRLEALPCWQEPELQTVGRLADHLRTDAEAMEAARLYVGRLDVDLPDLVGTLVKDETVPFAAPYRFKASGMRKRRAWERTWELQRLEDEVEARTALPPEDPQHLSPAQAEALRKEHKLDRIPVPPKYVKGDFRSGAAYSLRGKLDVPKERFIGYPDTRIGADGTAVVGWAGWDHLMRARALAGHLQRRKDEGADARELTPLLVGLAELVPWLQQWHNEMDPVWGERMGDFFRAYVDTETQALGLTRDDLHRWTP